MKTPSLTHKEEFYQVPGHPWTLSSMHIIITTGKFLSNRDEIGRYLPTIDSLRNQRIKKGPYHPQRSNALRNALTYCYIDYRECRRTDTHTDKLGLGRPCALMEIHHEQLGKLEVQL